MCTKDAWFVAHLLSVVIAFCTCVMLFYWTFVHNGGLGFDLETLFNWHPIFLIIGVFCLGTGLTMHKLWQVCAEEEVRSIHLHWNAFGLIFTLLGIFAVIAFKFENPAHQSSTWHSWTGYLSILLYLLYSFSVLEKASILSVPKFPSVASPSLLILILSVWSVINGFDEAATLSSNSDYSQLEGWSGAIATYISNLCILYGLLVIFANSSCSSCECNQDTSCFYRQETAHSVRIKADDTTSTYVPVHRHNWNNDHETC